MKKILVIASRSSRLALLQINEVMSKIPSIKFEIKKIESFGDLHKEISLLENPPEDIFTRELDAAILEKSADIGIHSAKDLPYPLPDGISVIALTECLDSSDALVSRNSIALEKLPAGARIGTSSPSRISQIHAIRPDLETVGIRGTIEERIALVDNGDIDALVAATCALKRLSLDSRIAQILPIESHDLQGYLAVTARSDRPELRALFASLDIRLKWGRAYLAGAGCGGREMLTLKAHAVLSHSDIIYYDDLVDESILDEFNARKIYVGKRKDHHAVEQNDINKMIFASVKEGKAAVRLKGGDPFIFGRGGEEAEYLARRLSAVEIIPGVTSALAAASSAMIPLTLRGISQSVSFATAHTSNGVIPVTKSDTQVFYMGASRLDDISHAFTDAGCDKNTPAAIVSNAGSVDERTEIRTIASLKKSALASPLIVITGNSVGKRIRYEKILYTGLDPFSEIPSFHGSIVHYPLIEIVEKKNIIPPDFSVFDSLIFTSKSAVNLFAKRYMLTGKKIYAIGSSTARELLKYGVKAEIPELSHSDSLAELLKTKKITHALYPCSSRSNNAVHRLTFVSRFDLYDVVFKKQKVLDLKSFSGIVFSSPSTADSFFELYESVPDHIVCYAMGPITEKALFCKGVNPERIINVQTIQKQTD